MWAARALKRSDELQIASRKFPHASKKPDSELNVETTIGCLVYGSNETKLSRRRRERAWL